MSLRFSKLQRLLAHRVPASKHGKSWRFLPSMLNQWQREQMTSNLNKRKPPINDRQKENDQQ